MNGEQIIPPITDPLGSSWRQPHRRFIELDDTHALMSEQTFKGLPDYTRSQPTGVYPGKMWRAHYTKGGWTLHWFKETPGEPNMCTREWRLILVID